MHLAMMSAQMHVFLFFLIQSIEMKLLGIAGLKTKTKIEKNKQTNKHL